MRRAGVAPPKCELREVLLHRLLKTGAEVFDGCSGTIVAFEIEVERLFISSVACQYAEHADDLGSFFVDCRSIEIVDFDKARWARRVCQWSGVFAELVRP